jgi:PII-like signaling protein
MENKITVRLYFEYGKQATGLSFWKRIWNNSFADEFLKRAKEKGIEQVICFNVTKGYLQSQAIQWGNAEILSQKHPQCIELIDFEYKIMSLLDEQKKLLDKQRIVFVKNEVVILTQ